MEDVGYCNCPSITYFCELCDRRSYSHIYWEKGSKYGKGTNYRVVQPTMHYGSKHVHGNCLSLELARRFNVLCDIFTHYTRQVEEVITRLVERIPVNND